jgi:DNA-binding response OmpR family regulator
MAKASKKDRSIESVVFADNDVLLLEAVGDFLRESGFRVHLAHDGFEALELCRREKPDCVILDVVMPKLDGARVCRLLRQDPALRNTAVIAFSSLSPRDYSSFPEMSADAYVAKGPLIPTCQNLLLAIRQLQSKESSTYADGIIGYGQVQQRQVVHEMLEERRHHANILRALGAGVLELDLQGRIHFANPGACEVLREKEANLIGERLTALAAPREREALENLLSEFSKAVEPHRCRTAARLRDRDVRLLICAVLDGETCASILIILESEGAPRQGQG